MRASAEPLLYDIKRRVARAIKVPDNTCAASRYLAAIAAELTRGGNHSASESDRHALAESALAILTVVESLWKARAELAKLKASKQ